MTQQTASESRDERQKQVQDWVARCFGTEVAIDPRERITRVMEESVELAQSLGMPEEAVHALVKYVYSRDVGTVGQEIGGVCITLLALCETLKLSANDLEAQELNRILSKDPEHFRQRQAAKHADGVALNPT